MPDERGRLQIKHAKDSRSSSVTVMNEGEFATTLACRNSLQQETIQLERDMRPCALKAAGAYHPARI